MSRLFTFGCSFTQYHWPTWADILGKEFDFFENWGLRAAGNQYIANSIIEASVRHNITTDDTVIVMWSSCFREDRYTDEWKVGGNLYMNNRQFYTDEFITKYVTPRGCFIRDLATIHMIDKYLSYTGCKYEMLAMTDLSDFLTRDRGLLYEAGSVKRRLSKLFNKSKIKNNPDEVNDVVALYQSTLEKIKPDFIKTIFDNKFPNREDWHPLPSEHLQYLETVLPNYNISNETRIWVESANKSSEQAMRNWIDTPNQTVDQIIDINNWDKIATFPSVRL